MKKIILTLCFLSLNAMAENVCNWEATVTYPDQEIKKFNATMGLDFKTNLKSWSCKTTKPENNEIKYNGRSIVCTKKPSMDMVFTNVICTNLLNDYQLGSLFVSENGKQFNVMLSCKCF